MRNNYLKKTLLICLLFILLTSMVSLMSCSKDEKPEIVGCNGVKYKGYTYTNLGCARGIASVDITTTQDGHTASFHIECSNGCISSVQVIEAGMQHSITGPCGCNDREEKP